MKPPRLVEGSAGRAQTLHRMLWHLLCIKVQQAPSAYVHRHTAAGPLQPSRTVCRFVCLPVPKLDTFISLNLCPDSSTLAKQSGRDVCRLSLRASRSSERISRKHGELRQSHAIQHRRPSTLNFNIVNLHSKQHNFITNKSVRKHNTADQQSRQYSSHSSQDHLSSHSTLHCHIAICALPGCTVFSHIIS